MKQSLPYPDSLFDQNYAPVYFNHNVLSINCRIDYRYSSTSAFTLPWPSHFH